MKHVVTVFVLLFLAGSAVLGWGYAGAIADPIVRRATIAVADWPTGAPSLRVALISDTHVAGPDMPPERLARIVAQVNATRPDLVLIAGDLVSDRQASTHRYSAMQAVAPFARFKARLGVVAVLGNHDHWRSATAFRRALFAAHVTVLANDTVRRGPLMISGIDDIVTGHDDLPATIASADAMEGPHLILSHSPEVALYLPERFGLILAGHTHCEQIDLPSIGPLTRMSRYGCGVTRVGTRTIVIGAGVGTSILPLRIGVPPDFWVLTIGA